MDNGTSFHSVLQKTMQYALAYLDHLDSDPVGATVSYQELRARLARPLADQGTAPENVIDDLVTDSQGGIINGAGGRFFGWVVGGALPAALAADWMTSTWDQNAALYASGPAEAVVEEVCGQWLKELMGLPTGASFALVTGCQMAHTTCIAAARHGVLVKTGWNVEKQGLTGSPQIRVLCGGRHGSIDRALRLLGFGSDCVIELPVDQQGHLLPETLAQALSENPGQPSIVLLQAGDLHTGVYDSFEDLIPLAHKFGAWVHVDGAFGLWAAASPIYSHLLKGVQLADSWATDGHKWLNVPYDCGYAFVADPRPHQAAMSHHASYLPNDNVARDQMEWTPEWSRRGRGFATYAAIRQLGRKGIADLVERTCRHAHALVTRIGALEGAEMVWEPIINQGLVRFIDLKPGATEADHDLCTNHVIDEIQKIGEAFFGGSTWHGRRVMRVSVSGWLTTDSDVDRTVDAVEFVLKRQPGRK